MSGPQAGQFGYGRRGFARVSRGVPDDQLERSPGDPASVIDVGGGQLESGEHDHWMFRGADAHLEYYDGEVPPTH